MHAFDLIATLTLSSSLMLQIFVNTVSKPHVKKKKFGEYRTPTEKNNIENPYQREDKNLFQSFYQDLDMTNLGLDLSSLPFFPLFSSILIIYPPTYWGLALCDSVFLVRKCDGYMVTNFSNCFHMVSLSLPPGRLHLSPS